MEIVEYSGGKVILDDEGYLVNFNDWNEQVACILAEKEGIEELTKDRIVALKFIRDYYKEYNFFPIFNAICKNIHQPKNCVNEQFIEPLKAWKIAGLPKPDEEMINILEGQTPT
jgi:TusE/DsrC/DsvC family sulfur relay protein